MSKGERIRKWMREREREIEKMGVGEEESVRRVSE